MSSQPFTTCVGASTRSAASLLAGAAVLAGIAVLVAAVHHAGRTDASPIVPAGGWLNAYRAAIVVAFVGYVAALFFLRRRPAPVAAVIALAAAIQLAPLAAPLLLSRDVYYYWDKGRIAAVHDRNPFSTRPSAFPHDVAYRYVSQDWRNRKFFYGPTMGLVADAHARIVGNSASNAADGYRVLAGISVLLVAVMLAAFAPRRAFATALVGWNPLLALHFAGGGHNDGPMMALFIASFLLAWRRLWSAASVSWVLAVAYKWILLIFLPLQLLGRRRSFTVPAAALAALALIAVATDLWQAGWLHSITALRAQSDRVSSLSFAWWLSAHVGGAQLTWAHGISALFVLAYLALLYAAWRTGRARMGLTAGLLVAATPFLVPWYAIWPASLTAMEEDDTALVLLVALTAWLLHDAVSF